MSSKNRPATHPLTHLSNQPTACRIYARVYGYRNEYNAGGQLLSGPQLIVALSPRAEASGFTGKSAQRRMKLVSCLDLCGALLQVNRLVMHIVCPSPRLDATGPRTRAESRSGGKGLRPSEPQQVLGALRRELGAWSTRP